MPGRLLKALLELRIMDPQARPEVALGVDEEVVGAEPGHVGGAHVGIVPLQLLVPLLLLLRQVAGCKR